jgi:hypothetical protein
MYHTASWIFDINKHESVDTDTLGRIRRAQLKVEVRNEEREAKGFQVSPDLFEHQNRAFGFGISGHTTSTATIEADSNNPDDKIFLLESLRNYGKINVLIYVEPTGELYLCKAILTCWSCD